jgi:hypothetical protein
MTAMAGSRFALPLEDREEHDGGADVGDDEEDLEQRARGHARVGAGTDDVVGVVEHWGVEQERCWDSGDVGDKEQDAGNECSLSRGIHLSPLCDEVNEFHTIGRRGSRGLGCRLAALGWRVWARIPERSGPRVLSLVRRPSGPSRCRPGSDRDRTRTRLRSRNRVSWHAL